jgi:hypothetical protein
MDVLELQSRIAGCTTRGLLDYRQLPKVHRLLSATSISARRIPQRPQIFIIQRHPPRVLVEFE